MKKKIIFIASILAVVLVIGAVLTAFNRPRVIIHSKIEAPESASSNFSGTMLANYDSLNLNFGQDYCSFDFDNVVLNKYDFLILDLIDANLCPNDSFGVSLELSFSDEKLNIVNHFVGSLDSSATFTSSSYPYFNIPSAENMFEKRDYTYLLDLRGLENGNVSLLCYMDGIFSTYHSFTDISSEVLLDFLKLSYSMVAEDYSNFSIQAVYLYGFENAEDCTIGRYVSDRNLNLSNCEDSLLYKE